MASGYLSSRAAASRAALVNDAGIARNNSAYIANRIADAESDAANEHRGNPRRLSGRKRARHLSTAVLYSVLANAGDGAFVFHRERANGLVTSLQRKLGRLIG
jgi:4-hydroxybenzoate polyprenyltransferase